jgi:hypothetical protein
MSWKTGLISCGSGMSAPPFPIGGTRSTISRRRIADKAATLYAEISTFATSRGASARHRLSLRADSRFIREKPGKTTGSGFEFLKSPILSNN